MTNDEVRMTQCLHGERLLACKVECLFKINFGFKRIDRIAMSEGNLKFEI